MASRRIFYGTPIIDEDDIPEDQHVKGGGLIFKKPVKTHEQIVTDDKGRRRFHGAFTGGFSAGYFNTVDTPEGWNPSTFKSSRKDKISTIQAQKPEDYMDMEDFSEYGIAPKQVEITKKAQDKQVPITNEQSQPLFDMFFAPIDLSIGLFIFNNQGGRAGKGIGEKSTNENNNNNKAILQISDSIKEKSYGCSLPPGFKKQQTLSDNIYLFFPHDLEPIIIVPKNDIAGVKATNDILAIKPKTTSENFMNEHGSVAYALGSTFMENVKKQKRKGITGQAFGYGAFEDSDEEGEKIWDDTDYSAQKDKYSTIMDKYDIPLYSDLEKANKQKGKYQKAVAENETSQSMFNASANKDDLISNFTIKFKHSALADPQLSNVTMPKSTITSQNVKFRHNFKRDGFIARICDNIKISGHITKFANYLQQYASSKLYNHLDSQILKSQSCPTTTITQRAHLLQDHASQQDQSKRTTGKPLFEPFQYNPAKQKRYKIFLSNLQQYIWQNPNLVDKNGKGKADFFSSLSTSEMEYLFRGIHYSDITEWDRDREKTEFANIATITFLKSAASKFSSTVKNSAQTPNGSFSVDLPPPSGLLSRFHKSSTLATLDDEKSEYLKENEQEKQLKTYLEKGQLGLGTTRTILDWTPDALLCKRFGVKFLGLNYLPAKLRASTASTASQPSKYLAKPIADTSTDVAYKSTHPPIPNESNLLSISSDNLNDHMSPAVPSIDNQSLYNSIKVASQKNQNESLAQTGNALVSEEIRNELFDSSSSIDSEEEIKLYKLSKSTKSSDRNRRTCKVPSQRFIFEADL